MPLSSKQPTLFEVFGRSETSALPEINQAAVDSIVSILAEGDLDAGKVILLKSPRAGYGKTLLLQAVKRRVGEGTRFFAVEPSGGGRLDGEVVLESVLRQLSVVLPASGGLTEFDFFARRLLAVGLRPLLVSGEIPSHDREGALFAIENRPIETFDFHHQQAATAHWTQANFEVLGPRLAAELSEVSHCGLQECAYWIELLFKYATTAPERVERSRYFAEAVFGDLKGLGSSAAEERLQSLLGLLALVQPIVLVFDETEGLSNRPEMGLKVAAFVVQLRQACPGLTVILSLNEDVWNTGLTPLMPGGLKDRLTEYVVALKPLEQRQGVAILRHRFGSEATRISEKMEWPEPIYCRAILKNASSIVRQIRGEEETTSTESLAVTPPPLTLAPTAGVAETAEIPERSSFLNDDEAAQSQSSPQEIVGEQSLFEKAVDLSPDTHSADSVDSAPEVAGIEESAEAHSKAPDSMADGKTGVFAATPVPFSQEELLKSSPSEASSGTAPEQQPATKSPFSIVDEPADNLTSDFAGNHPRPAAEVAVAEPLKQESAAVAAENPFSSFETKPEPRTESKTESKPEPELETQEVTAESQPFEAAQPDSAAAAAVTESPFSKESDPAADRDFAGPVSTPAVEKKDGMAEMRSPFESTPIASSEAQLSKNPFGDASAASAAPASPFDVVAETPKPAPKPEVETPASPIESAAAVKSPFDVSPTTEAESPIVSQAVETPRTDEVLPENPFGVSPQAKVLPDEAPTPLSPTTAPEEVKSFAKTPELENQEVEDLLNQFKKRFGQPGGSA